MFLQRAVSQRGWQSQPESEHGPKLLQQADEMLWKKQCCKSGRGEQQAQGLGVWRVQTPGNPVC